ncbi:MAG TPA: response regulator [Candidatus Deferrimicrobium sp.]|nr:response regulator [Candidatus Deferrimicrobium sp.]
MRSASGQLHDYYRLRASSILDRISSLVDTIAAQCAALTQADFTVLFCRTAATTSVVPVAYYHRPEIAVVDLHLLKDAFTLPIAAYGDAAETFYDSVSTPGEANSPLNQFAQRNGFHAAHVYPYHAAGGLRAVIISYWRHPPVQPPPTMHHLLEPSGHLLVKAMMVLAEMQALDDYSSRVSKLAALYELPYDEYSGDTVLSEILTLAKQVLPQAGVCLLSWDAQTGNLTLRDVDSEVLVPEPFLKDVCDRMERIRRRLVSQKAHKKRWYDLSSYYGPRYTGVVAVELCPGGHLENALVVFTERAGGFVVNDLVTLSVLGAFAKTALQISATVTSLKRSKRVLEQSTRQMADVEAFAVLADMTSGVAHDFNNIFGGAMGRLQILKLKTNNEDLFRDLTKIETLLSEGADTVRRVQEFAVTARPKEMNSVDLCRVLRDCLCEDSVEWRAVAAKKEISISYDTAVEEATVVGCDADITTAVHKLLDNAAEHSPEKGTVSIRVEGGQKYFTIEISDHGPGIVESIRPRVFYPFFSTKNERGAGLGLAIVHGIMARHGGKVSFECGPENGTVFRLAFPRPAKEDEISEITGRTSSTDKLNILVVDDDEQIREVLTDMLTIEGHRVSACPDGYAALKALSEQPFDLLITDLGMPGLSGIELAGQVHTMLPHMQIAMITGWGTQLSRQEVLACGIKSVLSKPFHLKEIKALVQELAPR